MTMRARRKPTARQLEVLATYARTGSYKVTAEELGIARGTVQTTLLAVRARYEVETTIQAYRTALAAGHLRRSA
jgi:DNA-binding CsgD family transcriptional regulator